LQKEAIQLPDNFHHELESFLEKQLDRTNYWLSFAEAKNAALIAFNVAIIAFIAEFQEDLPIFSTVIMILSVVSTVICLISFIPITNNCTTINTHATAVTPNEQKDNLIFWHDIAKLEDENEYINSVISRYCPQNTSCDQPNKLCLDFASEILINSRIAKRKYTYFKIALSVDILALLICVLLFITA